jgi:hypothetical protein
MSKRAIRIPALRAGRRVRWTIEMSADVGGENGAPSKKASRKRHRATTVRRVTPVGTTTSPAQAVAPPVTLPVAHPTPPARRGTHLQMVAAAMITMFVVTLTLSRRPAPLAAAAAEDAPPGQLQQWSDIKLGAQPVATASAPTAAGVALAPVIAPQAVREASAKAAVLKSEKNRIAEAASPTAAVNAIDEALGKIDSTTELVASESISVEPAPVAPDPRALGTVTVTGCLESSGNDNRFRLTDTEGGDAPRSRNWRTGFLKKRSTSVALVDPPDPHELQTQVGQRVAATGLLTSRELRVASLRVIGPRCN